MATITTFEDRYISVYWAARRLGFSERTIRAWARAGRLPANKRGPKLWEFKPGDIERFKRDIAADLMPRKRRRTATGGDYAPHA